jgi:U3 small nucleolar RNA-associated protein 19
MPDFAWHQKIVNRSEKSAMAPRRTINKSNAEVNMPGVKRRREEVVEESRPKGKRRQNSDKPSLESQISQLLALGASEEAGTASKPLKTRLGKAWLAILASPSLTEACRKTILREALAITPWMSRPEILMDFFTDCYNVEGSTSLLALSGLFDLMNSKNLDYPSFFPKLYSLLDANLLPSKHRSRFMRLLNTFLGSSHLPASLVASFIKRLSRLALMAPPAAIVAIVPYIYNILKAHPTCTFMIHRKLRAPNEKTNNNLGIDPFDMSEKDPQKTNAIDSSLWELETLQSHYHPNVASLARIISEQFTKQQYNLEDFLDHGYASMLESELAKEPKKAPVIEYGIPQRILTKSDDTDQGEHLVLKLWSFT